MSTIVSAGGLLEIAEGARPWLGETGGIAIQFLPDVNGVITAERRAGVAANWSDPEVAYRGVSALRTVVDYLVGRGAVVPIDPFVKVSRAERQPIDDGVVPQTLAEPFPGIGTAGWLSEILFDSFLWDRWCTLICEAPNPYSGDPQLALARLAPWLWRYGNKAGTDLSDRWITVAGEFELSRDQVVTNHGRGRGSRPTETLVSLLNDLEQSSQYREQTWRNGARISGVVERPAAESEEQDWSETARDRFKQEWRSFWTGTGPDAGGTPILEDGMKFSALNAFSAKDTQWQEGRTGSLIEMCMFFHLAPEVIGARQAANASQAEHRKDLYGGTLAPVLLPIAEALTFQFVRRFHEDPRAYAAFNIDMMIQGTFDEIIASLTTAVGGPWMLRDEARGLFNRAPLPDGVGSEVIVPMNVVEGGLPSPHSTAPGVIPSGGVAPKQLLVTRTRLKAKTPRRIGGVDKLQERLGEDIAGVYKRMRRDVMRQIPAEKAMTAAVDWNEELWPEAIKHAVKKTTSAIASIAAHHVLSKHAPDYDWSDDPMDAWLDKQATSAGVRVNAGMRSRVSEAIAAGGAVRDAVSAVFDDAEENRSGELAKALVAGAVGLGTHDAASASGLKSKVWRVTSGTPRESHAALDGESVELGGMFSNGGRWPGDADNLPIDEVAGCTCQLEVS